MTKILFESTKDLYIEKLYRRYQEWNTWYMHSIVLKIVIRKNSSKERKKKSCKHVRGYAVNSKHSDGISVRYNSVFKIKTTRFEIGFSKLGFS